MRQFQTKGELRIPVSDIELTPAERDRLQELEAVKVHYLTAADIEQLATLRAFSEFSDEAGSDLKFLMDYCPALGDEFWAYSFALVLEIEAEGEPNHYTQRWEDSTQGWECRSVKSVALHGRRDDTAPEYPDQIVRCLNDDDSQRVAELYRDRVDGLELDDAADGQEWERGDE